MKKVLLLLFFTLLIKVSYCQYIFDDSCSCFKYKVFILKQKHNRLVFNNDKENYTPLGEKVKDLYGITIDSCKKNNNGKYEFTLKIIDTDNIFEVQSSDTVNKAIFYIYILKKIKNNFIIERRLVVKYATKINLSVDFNKGEYIGVCFNKNLILSFGNL